VTPLRHKKFRVFIIHPFEDIALVKKIKEEFESYPEIKIIIAERFRRPGDILAWKLMELIENCQMVLVVWSHSIERSILANQEIGYAMALEKPICPFVASGIEPKGFLEGTEYIEFNPYIPEPHVRNLAKHVRKQARKPRKGV
jgi:hypothetical protein